MATKPATKPPLKSVPAAAEEEAPVAKKKKSKLMLILPIVFVLLAGAGGGAWYFLHKGKDAEAAKAAEPAPVKPPVFVNLEPFTVNLQGGEHFLQIGLVLQVNSDETSEAIKVFLPQIRNSLLLLLSSKTPEELASIDAKHKLADEILAETRKPLGPAVAEGVQAVLFGSMVVQ
ncbi:MAG: flagellar basal body-associated protein FliL [Burkholderiaceae bacterium]|jgi:flagellar FliL protein